METTGGPRAVVRGARSPWQPLMSWIQTLAGGQVRPALEQAGRADD